MWLVAGLQTACIWSPLLFGRPGQDSLVTPLLHPGVDCSGRHELQCWNELLVSFIYKKYAFDRNSHNAVPVRLSCYDCRRGKAQILDELYTAATDMPSLLCAVRDLTHGS